MAQVSVTNIQVDGPAKVPFLTPFRFNIFLDVKRPLEHGKFPKFKKNSDLHWKIVYVGSAESSDYDQVLEEFIIDEVPIGTTLPQLKKSIRELILPASTKYRKFYKQ